MKDPKEKIRPLDVDEVYGKPKKGSNRRRAEEVNELKLDGLKFYNLQKLVIEDLSFPWSLSKSEMRGCAVYEFYRSRVAIWLDIHKESTPRYAQILKAWGSSLAKPWPLLDSQIKDSFVRNFTGDTVIPCEKYRSGMKDPWPSRRGELFLIKIDLSVSNTELKKMFDRTLRTLPPFKNRTEVVHEPSIIEDLESIVAHRIAVCCGDMDPWKFALKINAKIGGKLNGNSIFSRKDLWDTARRRFIARIYGIDFTLSDDGVFRFRPVSSL
jgi:hypothetical protein